MNEIKPEFVANVLGKSKLLFVDEKLTISESSKT